MFNALPSPLNYVVPFVIVLGVLVFFHELGHYLAARWRGVHVEAFSIGFGQPLVSWTDKRGTQWKIAWIPLGGYVKLHGLEQPADVDEATRASWQPGRTFHDKQVGSRAIVVAAGPIANFVLATVLFVGLFITVGEPILKPVLYVPADSAAARAGLQTGDVVTAIDGQKVRRYDDIARAVEAHPGQSLQFDVQRGAQSLALAATPGVHAVNGADHGDLGFDPLTSAEVGGLGSHAPAERAGIRIGDVIESVDGEPVHRFEDVRRLVSARPAQQIVIGIRRGGVSMSIKLTTQSRNEDGKQIGMLGVAPVTDYLKVGPGEALVDGASATYMLAEQTLAGLWGIIVHRHGADELGGPLRIAQMSGEVAERGPFSLINFVAFLSVNLGLINLFPIPVLDGGHLVFYLAEFLRGRPLPKRALQYGFQAGLAVLVGLFVFVTWNDLSHFGLMRWVRDLIG